MIARILLKRIYIGGAIGVLLVGVLFLLVGQRGSSRAFVQVEDGTRIPVTVADTPKERQQGLSGTTSLPLGTGKLFVFATEGAYGFWMKDMQYPIAIVWIGSDEQVVGVTRDVAPETYPSVFYPPQPVRYVLELNADDALVDTLVVGAKLRLQK